MRVIYRPSPCKTCPISTISGGCRAPRGAPRRFWTSDSTFWPPMLMQSGVESCIFAGAGSRRSIQWPKRRGFRLSRAPTVYFRSTGGSCEHCPFLSFSVDGTTATKLRSRGGAQTALARGWRPWSAPFRPLVTAPWRSGRRPQTRFALAATWTSKNGAVRVTRRRVRVDSLPRQSLRRPFTRICRVE